MRRRPAPPAGAGLRRTIVCGVGRGVARPGAAAEITLAFAGDVHFTGRTLALLDEPGTAIGPYATLRAADFAMVNLETAITTRGTPQPKRFHFRAPTSVYAALLAAGIDLVSIANNHTLDYGQLGLTDTVDSAPVPGCRLSARGERRRGVRPAFCRGPRRTPRGRRPLAGARTSGDVACDARAAGE